MKLLQFISLFSVGIICLGLGFFFGQKTKQNPNTATKADVAKIATIAKEEVKYVETPVLEVYFFKLDENRICPKDYQIKAKFGTDTPVFYLKTNKFYDRVKPELCFVSKEKAIEKGFVEKK